MNNDFINVDSLSENDEVDGLHRTEPASPNFRTELAAQLAELVPEAIADGQVDVEKLRELLDGDAADTSERFGLFWPGKKRAQRLAQEPTTATLRPDKENSKDWDTTKNVFIEGDNLEVLKILQKHYHNKIKMIYIDPPYNTGKDFVYKDNFRHGIDTYLEWTQQVNEEGKKLSTNSDSEGRYHSNWLNMMYPRLKLAKNLLSDDGLMFISIDDNEFSNLLHVCNEIFGERNHVNTIVWHYGKMSNEKVKLPNNHEYILVYRRSDSGGIFNKVKKEDSEYRNRYIKFVTDDNKVLYGDVKNSTDNLISLRVKKVKANLGKEFLNDEDVLFDFNEEFKGHSDVIYASTIKGNSEEKIKEFDTGQKPLALMDLLVKLGTSNKDDLVLDFFAGSGSTANAVMDINAEDGGKRRYIMVQIPEPTPAGSRARVAGFSTIAELSRHRIVTSGERLIEREGAIVSASEIGFRTYSLIETNFATWRQNSDVDSIFLEEKLLSLRRGSSADYATIDDLLTEVLLKQGYSLTETISNDAVAGLDVRLVLDDSGDASVLAYLDEHTKPTLDQLRAFVDRKPDRIIILEDAFQGDDELKTNLTQLCKSRDIELWTA